MVTERRVYRVEGEDIVEDGTEDTNPAMPSAKLAAQRPPRHLLPFRALDEVAFVLDHGNRKNGRKAGDYLHASRDLNDDWDAAHGHLVKGLLAGSTDRESKRSHLAHAAARILIMLENEVT